MKQHIRIKQNDKYESYITVTKQKSNKFLVREILVETGTYVKKEDTTAQKRTVANETQAEFAAQELFTARASTLRRHSTTNKTTNATEVSPLRAVCDAIKKALDQNETIVFTPAWKSAGTNRGSFTYFYSTFLPFIEDHYSAEDGYCQIFTEEIKELYNSKFAAFSIKQNNSGENDIMMNSLSKQFYRANIVYQYIRENYPNLMLPEADFNVGNTNGRQREQRKELDPKVRNKFAKEMKLRAIAEPIFVMAGVLMMDGMLRTAESCAMGEDCIHNIDNFNCFVHVKYQLDKNNIRTSILKSDNAYRLVILSYWGTQMIKLCLYYAQQMGLTPGNSGIKTHDFSRWVLEILRKCGAEESFIAEAEDEFRRYLVTTTESVVADDIGAYIFRRDGASRLRNYCHVSETELDYQMGHRHGKKHINFISREWMIAYAKKLELYVYDSEMSRNTALCPVFVKQGIDIRVEEFEEIKIRNDSLSEISLKFTVLCKTANSPCIIEYSDKDVTIDCVNRTV